jgi:putative endonuclease
MSRYRNGIWAEYYAAAFLMIKGYRVLKMRYKTKVGEIDIVAHRGKMMVFAEVKFRKDIQTGMESISTQSRTRIRRAAEYYMMENMNESNTINYSMRMDAVIINHSLRICHIKNAF